MNESPIECGRSGENDGTYPGTISDPDASKKALGHSSSSRRRNLRRPVHGLPLGNRLASDESQAGQALSHDRRREAAGGVSEDVTVVYGQHHQSFSGVRGVIGRIKKISPEGAQNTHILPCKILVSASKKRLSRNTDQTRAFWFCSTDATPSLQAGKSPAFWTLGWAGSVRLGRLELGRSPETGTAIRRNEEAQRGRVSAAPLPQPFCSSARRMPNGRQRIQTH